MNKNLLKNCVLLVTLFVSGLCVFSYGGELYVSPQGKDSNSGTKAKPFATLEAARDAGRAAKKPVTIILRGGSYVRTKTFELDGRDSGVVYKAADGEVVRISGGFNVSVKELKPVTNKAVVGRLPKHVVGKVVGLALHGETKGGSENWPLRFRGYAGWPEVYAGGKALRLARWPNEGYVKIARVLDKGSQPRNNEKPDRGGRFIFNEDNPGRWDTDKPIYLGGYWCFKWYDEFVRVKSIDLVKKEIQMAAPHNYGLGGPSKGLYFAINLLEELDQPGEYVYDGDRNKLYIYLPENWADVLNVSRLNKPLLSIKNARDMSFSGIIFENGCDKGIEISGCESVRLVKCTVRQISGTGVDIQGGKECGVDKCHVHTIGKTAVSLSGGDRETLTPSMHFVTSCQINNFARLVHTYCPAVKLNGVGQIVSNNYMYDAPHCAILFGGNDHQMTFNHIERVCLDTSDAGAIYCGRDWTLGGNCIHGNYIHHLGESVHHQNWAIYLDDMASGIEVSKNVVVDTDAGFLIGGGRSNIITDNLIANCRKESLVFDARATGWAGFHTKKPDGTLWERLNAVDYNTGIWNERFAYLAKIEEDAYKEPRRNVITGNWLFNVPAMRLNGLVTKYGTVKDNVVEKTLGNIELKDGRLNISNKKLKTYESLIIGPR
jgi:hypothetical protein